MTDSSSSLVFSQTLQNLASLHPLLKRYGCSLEHLILLDYLREPATMTSVSKQMGHSTAAATGAIDRLEKLGLVARSHDSADRRQVFVQLTAKALALLNEAAAAYAAAMPVPPTGSMDA